MYVRVSILLVLTCEILKRVSSPFAISPFIENIYVFFRQIYEMSNLIFYLAFALGTKNVYKLELMYIIRLGNFESHCDIVCTFSINNT